MKKKCDLCSGSAMSYCESDEASLCWACDATVHRANFLAAKHCRVILCQVCQDPTRWSGSGLQLDPTSRVCPACDDDDDAMSVYVDGSCTDEESESDDDDDKDDDDDDDGRDDDDDQVVPTTMCIRPRRINNS